MNKKKYLLLLILVLLTGCTCEYNLTIDNSFLENTTINFDSSEDFNYFSNFKKVPIDAETYRLFSSIPIPEEGAPAPEIEYDSDNYDVILRQQYAKYSYDFNRNEFAKSTAISLCYDTYTITNREGNLIISTNNFVRCFENNSDLTSLTINISTTKEVEKSNADEVKNNKYTWRINRENYQNKPINMIIKNPITGVPDENNIKKTDVYFENASFYLVLLAVFGVALIAYLIIKRLKNNSNNNKIDD